VINPAKMNRHGEHPGYTLVPGADVVLWYVFGIHHLTRPEDWPVMPADTISFLAQTVRLLRSEPRVGHLRSRSPLATRTHPPPFWPLPRWTPQDGWRGSPGWIEPPPLVLRRLALAEAWAWRAGPSPRLALGGLRSKAPIRTAAGRGCPTVRSLSHPTGQVHTSNDDDGIN
jgi:hypothetical protein